MSRTVKSSRSAEYPAPEIQTITIAVSSSILDQSTGSGSGDNGEEEEG